MTRKTIFLGVACMAAMVAAACDQSPTALPGPDTGLAALVVPTTTARNVIVCKDGPAGTYDFTIAANTGSVTLLEGSSFSVDADECKTVANASANLQSVTVTEQGPPAGTLFSSVDIYRFMGTTSTQTLIGTSIVPNVTVSPFGEDVGFVLVYHNIPDPETGCTLTQGYWKTHSEFGPAPYDNTWAQLASGASTPFFLSGQSWYQVFGTPPHGNAYYNLAHQYMAAVLNGLAGAGAPQAVIDAISDAEDLFNAWTPAQIALLKGNNSLRQQFLGLAETLGAYNEGTIGPGHCGT